MQVRQELQCDKAILQCIFSYDGTDRIRFAGQGTFSAQSQPEASGTPKMELFCDSGIILAQLYKMSSHFQIHLLAAQDVEVQMGNGLTGVRAAVGSHTVAVIQALCLGDLRDHLKNVSNDGAVFAPGERVIAVRIEGVKLIVAAAETMKQEV